MGLYELGMAAAVLFLGGALQGAVGFALVLVVMPMLLWLEIPMPVALPLVTVGVFAQTLTSAWRLRRDVPWPPARRAVAIRLAGMILGTLLLKRVLGASADLIRPIVGAIICATVFGQWAWRVPPRERLHPFWDWLAFLSSGLLGGLCGTGGPPVAFWVSALTWDARKSRAFMYVAFGATVPLQWIMLVAAFGNEVLSGLLAGLLLTPAVILGTLVGLPVGNRFSKPLLRRVTYLLLLVIGVKSIADFFV